MLEVKDLYVNYGAIEAIKGISFTVQPGEIVTLIGANGAGKTTTLHTISGLVKAKSGSITYNGTDLQKIDPSKIISLGIAHVPEGRHVFPEMTVEENLQMGAFISKNKEETAAAMQDVYEKFPRLRERRRQLAWSMSGGEQQMLAIGRALMGKPKLLMLDEPSMGLAPIVIDELFEKIVEVNKTGVPILMVEQNANLALRVSNRAYILDRGRITAEGPSQSLLKDPKVREAYLGKSVAKE